MPEIETHPRAEVQQKFAECLESYPVGERRRPREQELEKDEESSSK